MEEEMKEVEEVGEVEESAQMVENTIEANAEEVQTAPVSHCRYDDVFKTIRSFGPVQIILFASMHFLVTLMAMQYGILVFAMGTPRFYCADANITCEDNVCCTGCTNYVYDEGQFTSTVTEWNLLCDRAYLAATIQSCYFGGMFFGAFVGGWMSDNFGRKPTIFIGVGVMELVSLGSMFSDAISLLALLRFVIGFFQMVLNVTYFVYAIEIIGPKHRTLGGQLCSLFWLTGYSTTAVFAYFIRDWRMLILAVTVPGLLFLLSWKIFPASPRWLIAHNRLDEAHAVLLKYGAKDSTNPVDEEALRTLIADVRKDQIERHKMDDKRYTQLDLVRTPKLRKRSIILFYTWVVCAIVHFGFFLYVTSLTGNLYVNYVIMNVITIPKALGFLFIMNRFGRRIPYSACMFLSGLFCFLILAIPKEYSLTITVLAMLGKSFMSAQFLNAFLYGSELFPTVVRSNAVGCGTMTSRLGGMLTPYIAMLGQLPGYGVYVPATIFGVLTVAGAIMSLWLPETLFAKLSQTVEEAEAAKEDYGIICWGHHKRRRYAAARATDDENIVIDDEDHIKDTTV